MPKYIDPSKIRLTAVGTVDDNGDILVSVRDVKKAIAQTPAADVVEVVRCKDCVHKNPCCFKCLRDNLWHDTDDYCSYGKRKETQ